MTIQGASFNNWLDAVDASFCTFEGGDDPTQVRVVHDIYIIRGLIFRSSCKDGIYPDPLPGGFKGKIVYSAILAPRALANSIL